MPTKSTSQWRRPVVGGWLLIIPAAALLGLLSAASAQTKTDVLNSGPHLVGWWKFEETAGKTAADSAPHGHPGSLEGGMSFESNSAPGRSGRALRFDGKDGLVRMAGFKGVTGDKPRTVAVWIKTTSTTGEVVSWGTDDHGKMWILGFIRQHLGVTPKGGYLYMKAPVQDDAWHHVAVVVQPASPPNLHDHVKLFKDGDVAAIDDIGFLDLWPIETGNKQDVTVGRRFKGLVDDLRIYDRALDENEINALSKPDGAAPPTKP